MKSVNVLPRFAISITILFLYVMGATAQEYVLVGWNDLGMHCSNKYFGKIAVLPPFNNVNAQLILKAPNQSPQLVNTGVTIEYSIPGNSYSAGKTDFWTYAQQLFGLSSPLPQNIGLTGKGLTGVLDSAGTVFSARGIPLTPYQDSDVVNENPFQLIHLVAKRSSDGTVLATTDAVIPVSNEVGCVQSGCHASEQAILNAHEDVSGFNRNGPVLCASCHASNALGTTGMAEARPFSYRMHSAHSGAAGPANSISTCYKCHPGPKTQCLRDIMGKNPTNPLVCQNCHGTLDSVANSISRGRRPWLDEPQCGKCHGSAYAEESGKLFRQSVGHGGLYCSACHGSPHAIQPTIQPNDNIQNIRLQGYAGTLKKCSVCHSTPPNGPGPHGITDSTVVVPLPGIPALAWPGDRSLGVTTNPLLQWVTAPNATSYMIQVAADSVFNTITFSDSAIAGTTEQLTGLTGGAQYYWRVRGLNLTGPGGWSVPRSFITGFGSTATFSFNQSWDMISIPMILQDPKVQSVFPGALSSAFQSNPQGGYSVKESLNVGPGYWLRFGSAHSVSMTGTPVSADTIDVADGWNLIGSVIDAIPAGSVVTIPPGIVGGGLFGYNNGYAPADTIYPAHGYWIKVSGLGKLILANSPAMAEKSGNRNELITSAGKIVVTDATGQSRTLYISNNPIDRRFLTLFDLPPVPPDGAFDVRFGSNSYLEVPDALAEKRIGISIRGAIYPVKICWSGTLGTTAPLLLINGNELPMTGVGTELVSDPASKIAIKTGAVSARVSHYELSQNFPNPFNPTTMIKYRLAADSRVKLTVTNMLGQVVATLVDGVEPAGLRQAEWNAGVLASGIYFYRLEAINLKDRTASFSDIRKMLLLR